MPIYIKGQPVWENLPAFSVDLDEVTVIGKLSAKENPDIFNCEIKGTGIIDDILWVKLSGMGSIDIILVDSDKVTQKTLEKLAENDLI